MGDNVSYVGSTGLGLHFTINPVKKPAPKRDASGQVKLPANTRIGQIYRRHGLRLRDTDISALKSSREAGVKSIDKLLGGAQPFRGFTPDERLGFSMKIADFLLEKSLRAQLSREIPTALDKEEQTAVRLQHMLKSGSQTAAKQGSAASLLKSIPVGVSLTVHLPVDWL